MAGLRNEEKFSREKMELVKDHLEDQKSMSEPVDYEIAIDNFKVVRRTNDVSRFDKYERYLTNDSRKVEVLIFTGQSNYSERRTFVLKDDETEPAPVQPAPVQEKGLSGIEVENMIAEGIKKDRKEREVEDLKAENNELEKEVKELESEVEKLENALTEMKAKESPLKGVFGEIGSVMVESFIKRNPQILASIPGGQALAGFLEDDSKKQTETAQQPELQVSFRASDKSQEESQEAKEAIGFVSYLKRKFSKEQFNKLLKVIDLLGEAPEKMDGMIEELNRKEEANGSVQV